MTNLIFKAIFALSLLAVLPATAETTPTQAKPPEKPAIGHSNPRDVLNPKANAAYVDAPVRVQSQLRAVIPLAEAATPADELKAMETSRNALYEMAGRECATLQDTFGVVCRLTGIAIDSGVTNRNMGSHTIQLSLTNSYELKRKP